MCLGAGDVIEAHLIPDARTQRHTKLFCYTGRDRASRQSAWLGVSNHAILAEAKLKTDLGNLGGFAGAGFTGNNHNLILCNGLRYFSALFRYR